MPPRIRPYNFPSRNSGQKRAEANSSREHGFAFLILMMVLTILLISLTVALPDVYTAGQREREAELIFRGNEYARAIMLYRRQFNHFPASVKDLVSKTNGYRFLRHAYRDPMTRSGNWRFIHATAAGVVIDAKTYTPPAGTPPEQKKPGTASQGTETTQPTGENSSTPASSPGASGASGTSGGPEKPSSAGDETKGAFIVGVASTSTHRSIRVWNNRNRYDQWEFIGIAQNPTVGGNVAPGTPGASGQPGSQPTGTPPGSANPPSSQQ